MAARITDEEWDKLSPENLEEIQETLSRSTALYPDSLCHDGLGGNE
ncbi:hypothetical protein [Candidatus Accumulibacter contiguus]|jgi:hypothetical protein|nr:hypothetical protein [Candidatus Accumulibacter contiguus]